ncbi:MAG TPA: selenocysteine-specific translation elongation factor [Verrucomicrobiales bacterium]|nr:selenocysteine-specific translation elongation factor [Verrucomicrobiales bacterium]
MSVRHFILGTAGHIDHGKSSLVEALTGTNPDRLPEEKKRGMTIELGFAELDLEATDGSGDSFIVGVVDVPGHSDFVKNMVAGVGAIDLALFIVAADDGWMPQTEEHYQILQYLGVKHVVIVLTKVDLVDDLELVQEDLQENLFGGDWEDARVIPVSSQTGQGIAELRVAISELLTATESVRDFGKPRMPVDRVFSLKGIGTVVTGTLIDGSIRAGSEIIVQPRGSLVNVRGAHSHGHAADLVPPGTRTALNLSGIGIRGSRDAQREGVGRGDVITLAKLGEAVTAIDVLLTKSDRPVRGVRNATRALRTGREVMFHSGSTGRRARVHFLGQRTLEGGSTVLAELRFCDPIYVFVGDRFVLRDASAGLTLAGGFVLDENANRRAFRKPFQETFLEERRIHFEDIRCLLRTQLVRDKAAFLPGLLAKSRFSESEIRGEIEEMISAGNVKRSGEWVFEAGWWKRLSRIAGERIQGVHREHPDHLGLPLRDLRTVMTPELPSAKFFDFLLAGLLAGDFTKAGSNIRHRKHQPRLPTDLVKAGDLVRKRLASDLVTPPNKGETATNAAEEKALRFLVHTGEVIDLDSKTIISRGGFDLIQSQIVAYLTEHGKATASELRQQTGTVRRILMPLLERLDADKVTIRNGDDRSLPER